MITISVSQARLNNAISFPNTSVGVGQTSTHYARVMRTKWQDLGETTDSYSICGWVQFKSLTAGSTVIGTNAEGGATSYPFKIDTNNSKLRFTIWDGTNAPSVSTSTTLSLNVWYHFVCIRHVADDKLYVYLNGSATPDNEAADSTTGTCKNTKKLGFAHDGGTVNSANILLSDIRVFNRVLTSQEINNIYSTGLTDVKGANPTDQNHSLLGWWKFNKNPEDYSNKLNQAIVVGSTYSTDYPTL